MRADYASLYASLLLSSASLGKGQSHQWAWGEQLSILGMHVLDPRLARPIVAGGLSLSMLGLPAKAEPLDPAQVSKCRKQYMTKAGPWSLEAVQALISASKPSFSSTCSMTASPCMPYRDHEMAQKRAASRNISLSLQSSNTADPGMLSTGFISGTSGSTFPHGPAFKEGREAACSRTSFPVLLVRRWHGPSCPGSGWSLVLPTAWVMPVWTALSYKGTLQEEAGKLDNQMHPNVTNSLQP
jgi:hypothetical protein